MPTTIDVNPPRPDIPVRDIAVGDVFYRPSDNQYFLKTQNSGARIDSFSCVSLRNFVLHYISGDTLGRPVHHTLISIDLIP